MKTMRRILQHVLRERRLLLEALVLAALRQVLTLANPLFFQYVIDHYVTHFREYRTQNFLVIVGSVLGAAVLLVASATVVRGYQEFYTNVLAKKVGEHLYSTVLEQILALPYIAFENASCGNRLAVLDDARSTIERFVTAAVVVFFSDIVGIAIVIGYAATIHWSIALTVIVAIPVIWLVNKRLGNAIRKVHANLVAETAISKGATIESFRNIELIKILGLAREELARLRCMFQKVLVLEAEKARYLRTISLLQVLASNLVHTSLLFLMLFFVYSRRISIGEYISLFIYSFFVFGPLHEIANVISVYREAEVSVGKVQEIMSLPEEQSNHRHLVVLQDVASIKCNDVSFRHPATGEWIIRKVSFCAQAGSLVAVVGPSGAGKTTLLKLLVGLYEATNGTILYDGKNLSMVDLVSVRRKIGFVTQDDFLFSGSIRDNLLFAAPDASDEACRAALRRAAVIDSNRIFNLDATVGEGGVSLSGGEKQRLAIARALLRSPKVMIFDEATSSLDPINEANIVKTIRALAQDEGLIVLMVAHTLRTTKDADLICVMDRGEIIERGRHEQLLRNDGMYRALWRIQHGYEGVGQV